MKVYYAHCMALYNTPQEQRDVYLLESLGFDVVNPNKPEVDEALSFLPKEERMEWFKKYAKECDVIAFRSLPDGRIPSGVAKEIQWFKEAFRACIELPSNITGRLMNYDQTKEYLAEVGQR